MKYILIAIKNLNRQKKRSFLLGGAIAFGILIITMINALTGSFVENVGENFSDFIAGHIFIEGAEKTGSGRIVSRIRDDSQIAEILSPFRSDIKYLTRRSSFRGALIFEGESVAQKVDGVDWEKESYLKERLILKGGSLDALGDPRAIILSDKIAKKLNVVIGDSVLAQLQTATGQQNVGEFTLAAISYDPGLFSSISAYANLAYVNELLDIEPHEYMTLGIFLTKIGDVDRKAAKIYKAFSEKLSVFPRPEGPISNGGLISMGGIRKEILEARWQGTRYQLLTINDILSQVAQLIRILDIIGLVILLVLFLIIMVGITNTFRMVMYERVREIGTMRALGMQRVGVRNLFLLEALFLSLGGAAAGIIAAGIAMFLLSFINFGFETPLYLFLKNGHLTFKFVPMLAGNILIVEALTLLAAYLPARQAARLEPARALGTHY